MTSIQVSPVNAKSPSPLNVSDQMIKFLKPDSYSRNCSPFFRMQSPNMSPIIKSAESCFLKKRELKQDKLKNNRRKTYSAYKSPAYKINEMTLSVKTVLKELQLTKYFGIFEKEELFRKLSLKSSEETEYKAKYQPQKNHSQNSISPSSNNNGHSRKKRLNHKYKRDSSRHKKSATKSDDEEEDDFTVPDRKKQSYIRSCIKKRLNNNYEKQINCVQDENVVFTDNKIYISLSARNSSLGSNNSLKKNRRIIYPTSGPCKLNGFLRHYDFSYDEEHQSPAKSSILNFEEKLKFNMMKEQTLSPNNSIENVVFEKVRMVKSSQESSDNYESLSSYIHVTNEDDKNDDSILTSSTVMYDEEEFQWQHFLELRKHGKTFNNNNNNNVSQLNDSGFGSQLFITTTMNNNNNNSNNNQTLDTWQDDETYDNSFNEELEQRVSIMFPDLYKASSQSVHFNNINNMNHVTTKKHS